MSANFPQYDSSDPEQVERVTEAAQLRRIEEQDFVRRLLRTYEGRAFIWMLDRQARTDECSFAGEAPMTMAYNEGRQDMGRWVREWVFTAHPAAYSMIRQEAVEREARYAAAVNLADEEIVDDG